jgi:hypothetical protein
MTIFWGVAGMLTPSTFVLTALLSIPAEKEKKQTYQEARGDCDYDYIDRLFAQVNYHLGSQILCS